jgi:hypothetical protein
VFGFQFEANMSSETAVVAEIQTQLKRIGKLVADPGGAGPTAVQRIASG